MLGVVNDVPVPNDEPPDADAYQLIVPAEAAAPSVTAPVPVLEPGVVELIVWVIDYGNDMLLQRYMLLQPCRSHLHRHLLPRETRSEWQS